MTSRRQQPATETVRRQQTIWRPVRPCVGDAVTRGLRVHSAAPPLHLVRLGAHAQGVYAIHVSRDGAHTKAGIAIGDDLDKVRERHPDAECATANQGTELVTYPYCRVRLSADRWLWSGHDPIRSIILTSFEPF